MRRVLIVGEFGYELAEMNTYLSAHFDTQLCADNSKSVKAILQMYEPDLILMDVTSFEITHNDIYLEIEKYNNNIPVVTYGFDDKKDQFISFYRGGQFVHVKSPYTLEDVSSQVCKCLNIEIASLFGNNFEETMKHVLVIDDNPILLRNMKGMLSEKYRVSMATSAAQGMKVLMSDRPDIVILDYEMPVVDGKQTLEMIRAEESIKDIPVIFLTGIADKDHVDSVIELHPSGYFIKPPIQSKMISAIEDILNKK